MTLSVAMIGLLSRTKSIWIGPALTVAAGVSYTLYIDDRNRLDTDTPLKFRPESVGESARYLHVAQINHPFVLYRRYDKPCDQ